MISANQFFQEQNGDNDDRNHVLPRLNQWRRVSDYSWRMERDGSSNATPSHPDDKFVQSMDQLLMQSTVGSTSASEDCSDRWVLELEKYLRSSSFSAASAKTLHHDRYGVMISAPLRLKANSLNKSLLEASENTKPTSFCLGAMTQMGASSPEIEFACFATDSGRGNTHNYVPTGYEGFESKEEKKDDVTSTSTVYYIMEIQSDSTELAAFGGTALEEISLIMSNQDGGGEDAAVASAESGIKAKLVSSTVWMAMLADGKEMHEDADINWLIPAMEALPCLSLPQPVGKGWKSSSKNTQNQPSMLLIVSLDESVANQNVASAAEESTLSGNIMLKFHRSALIHQNPTEAQLSMTHFSIGRRVQIVQHSSSEQEDIMKALEGAVWSAEKFIPQAKRRQWETIPDVVVSVLPHPTLPYNIKQWLLHPAMRKSDFDLGFANVALYLPYWDKFLPPVCHYVDKHTMLTPNIWRDLAVAQRTISENVEAIRANSEYQKRTPQHVQQHYVVDAWALQQMCRNMESIARGKHHERLLPGSSSAVRASTVYERDVRLRGATEKELGYVGRMLAALRIERLRCFEDIKKFDLYSVHWKGHTIEIPPPLIPQQLCPKCNPHRTGKGFHCMYHTASIYYEDATGSSPPPGKPVAIRTKTQLERLPRLLSMFPGESLVVKLAVPGVAEDFPLISIGDLVRFHFCSPGNEMSTEVIGEVADVVVRTEEVTVRLPSPFQKNTTPGCLPYLQALLHTKDFVVDAANILQTGMPPDIQAQPITDSNRKEMLNRFRFDVRFGFQGGKGFDVILNVLNQLWIPVSPPPKKIKKALKQNTSSAAQMEKDLHLNRIMAPSEALFHGVVHDDDRQLRLCKEPLPPLKFVTPVNLEQQRAVTDIAYFYHGRAPYIIEGPAGTGKSMCVCEAIIQVLRTSPKSKILVCAPSDAACDVLASRLLSLLDGKKVLRVNWWSRKVASVKPELLSCSPMDTMAGLFAVPDKKTLEEADVIVCQCFVAECLDLAEPRGFSTKNHFTHLFIDETSPAMECEAMVPMTKVGYKCSIVLAGDPKQLGPTIRDQVAASMGLGMSIQERLSKLPLYSSGRYCVMTRLVNNYRSNEALLTVPSSLFYKGSLQCSAPPEVANPFDDLGELGPAGFPLLLCDVYDGKECSKVDTPSFYNLEECHAIMQLAQGLLRCKTKEGVEALHTGQICVITPFRAQVLALRMLFRGSNLGGINVGVVEDFQGQEAKVVFISTVLTKDHDRWKKTKSSMDTGNGDSVVQRFGFLHDPKRFNVAITRAHALCVVVGNADYLDRSGTYWTALLDHIRRNDGVLGNGSTEDDFEDGEEADEIDLYGVADLLKRVEELQLLGSGVEEDMHDLAYYYSDVPQWKVMLS